MRTRNTRIGRSLLVAIAAGAVLLTALGTPALGEALRRPVIDPATARAAAGLQRWQDVATVFESAGQSGDPFYVAANAASQLSLYVNEHGWSGREVPRLVDALVATANADGGFGLGQEWDAYQDGSVNPASTSYTATTAGHVGPILLAGYQAGKIPASVVRRALDWVLDLPRRAGNDCIPYSSSPDDLAKPCVWNTYFGAAAWVKHASAVTGYRRTAASALVARAVSMTENLPIDPETGYLPYSAVDSGPQDIGHQLWTALSIDDLRGGDDAMDAMLGGSLWRTQARRFRDYNVASALSGIALFNCGYAIDPLVLAYADSTARGNPWAFKGLAASARQVAGTCFSTTGAGSTHRVAARSRASGTVIQRGLG